MCLLCIEIQQGKIRSQEEAVKRLPLDLDLGHYFEELTALINSLPKYNLPDLPGECTCGARHTSFPKHHLKYCKG